VLASALVEEILLLLKPLLADSSNKKLCPVVQTTPSMKPISEGSLEMEIAVASYNRFVMSYAGATVWCDRHFKYSSTVYCTLLQRGYICLMNS
jgi:hypothetical protein